MSDNVPWDGDILAIAKKLKVGSAAIAREQNTKDVIVVIRDNTEGETMSHAALLKYITSLPTDMTKQEDYVGALVGLSNKVVSQCTLDDLTKLSEGKQSVKAQLLNEFAKTFGNQPAYGVVKYAQAAGKLQHAMKVRAGLEKLGGDPTAIANTSDQKLMRKLMEHIVHTRRSFFCCEVTTCV